MLANRPYQESKLNENFRNARMDWAGFERSVRQTIDSVILYVLIEDIFSFFEFWSWGNRVEISHNTRPPFDEFDDTPFVVYPSDD